MYKNNKNGKILNVLLAVIALFIIIFIIAWVVNKGANTDTIDKEFKNNLEKMQEKAKEYFAGSLPNEIGDSNVITLEKMYDLKLTDKLSYGKIACDDSLSYISITKINATEYKVKSNLVCGNKTDNLVEKISTKTIVSDSDNNVIIDETKKDDVKLEVEKEVTSSDGKTADVVKCKGVICAFIQIETTCNTTYEYEYVKRNVTCPSGYVLSAGTCVKTSTNTTTPISNYTGETTVVEDAKVNKTGSYRVYTAPIITSGENKLTCDTGVLGADGYCYEYTDKAKETTKTCPVGYTEYNGSCYKFADQIANNEKSCPSGYTDNNGNCIKYTNLNSNTTYSCPSGYTDNGGNCIKYTNLNSNTSCTCPSGYHEENGTCIKYANLNSNTTYSCPAGWTQSGNTCYRAAGKSYSSWGNPTKTYQVYSAENTYEYELEKKILVGKNTVAGRTVYTYSVYKRSITYTCSEGTKNGNNCYKSATSNINYSCPGGYTKSGNTCYATTSKSCNTTYSCPSGYTKSGNTCYATTNKNSNTTYSCPSGYIKSGNTCYTTTSYNYTTKYTCPIGYTKSNNTCYVKTNMVENHKDYCPVGFSEMSNGKCYRKTPARVITGDAIYSCPAGYTKEGSGINTKCYKVVNGSENYYCETVGAVLRGNKCYITKSSQYTGLSCPSGYTLSGNTCIKTTKETANPIWTIADSMYSYAQSVPGYQRTGRANFVTKCTPINEHYK